MFEYPLIDKMTETGADIMLLISPRNHRKSTQLQFYFIDRFINYGEKFLLLRRKVDETISDTWLSEYARKKLEENGLKLTSCPIDRYVIEFKLNDEVCGYGAYCSVAPKYKSNDYGANIDIKNAALEEAIAENELETSARWRLLNKMLSVISTFCRSGQPRIFMLGNDCENGEHSQLIEDFNLTDKYLNINEVVHSEYEYLEKQYTVSYLYFSDDINKCQWLKSCDNVKKINLSDYRFIPLPFILIYSKVEYYVYLINEKFLYITTQKIDTDIYYRESDFLSEKLKNRFTSEIAQGIENPKTHNYFANLLRIRYYELKGAYNARGEYIPQLMGKFADMNFAIIDFDTYYKLNAVDKYDSNFERNVDGLMRHIDKVNNKIIFENAIIMLKMKQEEICK